MPHTRYGQIRGTTDERLLLALERFAFIVPDAFYDVGPHFSCREIEAVADLFRAIGRPTLAMMIVIAHARGDSRLEGDDPDHLALADAQSTFSVAKSSLDSNAPPVVR